MSVSTFTKTGTKATTPAKLNKAVFGEMPVSHELLKSAYVAYQANNRANLAVAKTRGQISGGGKKPWRQKGTGRARAGSIRSPIWRGGGITFGPTGEENYTHKLNKNAKRKAIRQALSIAANTGKVIVIEDLVIKSGKTADAVKLLGKINANQNALIIVQERADETVRATNNLPNAKVIKAQYANVYDILNADHIVITAEALKAMTDWLTPATKTAERKEETA